MSLFESKGEDNGLGMDKPLSWRMRPRDLSEFVGQAHIIGEGKLLRRAIEADRITSLILYGPPGCGKTALAYVIANKTKAHFHQINAVTAGISDIRRAVEEAKERRRLMGKKTILFIDEIHRFNKAQQDALLPDVEMGNVILIGATVHNPFFSIISALLSRSLVFELKPLSPEEITIILKRALSDQERGLGRYKVVADEDALMHIANMSDGDARRALNALEIGVLTTEPDKDGRIRFDMRAAEESIQKKAIVYDKDEDGHYDTISAFIKSMRGSDPDATLYWLAKMIYAGEDPRFIARRIVICAAEDVGNADPMALVVANAALQVAEFVGMPEAQLPLAMAAVYVASAPKSNASAIGIWKALEDVEKAPTMEVPMHLRGTGYKGAERLGHGIGYKYAHDYEGGYVEQDYMPEIRRYYFPTDRGFEAEIKKRLEEIRKRIEEEKD